eukprot:273381_1
MFNYRNHSHFQTPSMKTSKPSRNENINTFNINNMKNNDNNQIFSTIKRSKINTNRRFGTNLTNKRPMKRMNSNNKINKESNQKFNSSSFQFNIGINNKLNTNLQFEETEYCPSQASWKPSINKQFDEIYNNAYNSIGSYKLFIPANEIT